MTGTRASSMVRFGPSKAEIGAGRQRDRGLVHDMGVLDIAVGEDHLVDRLSRADLGQVALVEDRECRRDSAGPASEAG